MHSLRHEAAATNAGSTGDVSVDATGVNRCDANARVHQFHTEGFGEATYPKFGRAIRRLLLNSCQTKYARNIHNMAIVLLNQVRQKRFCHANNPEQIDTQQPIEIIERSFRKRPTCQGNPRIIDQQQRATVESWNNFLGKSQNRIGIRHIQVVNFEFATSELVSFGKANFINVGNDYVRSASGSLDGQRAANARRGSGDKDNRITQRKLHSSQF